MLNYVLFGAIVWGTVKAVNKLNAMLGYSSRAGHVGRPADRVFGDIPYFSLHPGSGDSMDRSVRDMYGTKDVDEL